MILVADSGSSKCDWILTDGKGYSKPFITKGLNPNHIGTDEVIAEVTPVFEEIDKTQIQSLFFYGSGCSSPSANAIIINGLKAVFMHTEIFVSHDIEGSAIATCGRKEGLACILGTGSNVCHWSGTKILEQVPVFGLGYILGDEGSGCYMGRTLIRKYLYNELPASLHNELTGMGLNKEIIVHNTYSKPGANVYLAGFTRFIAEHISDPFMENLVLNCFDEFFTTHIMKYDNFREIPVNFVGSVAEVFSRQLHAVASKYGAHIDLIINRPIERIVHHHLEA